MSPPDEEHVKTIRSRAARGAAKALLGLALVAIWSGWGVYRLDPGQAAVVFRFGAFRYIESREGIRWHFPAPVEDKEIVLVDSIVREEFGLQWDGEEKGPPPSEAVMQTRDNNIVNLSFVVQYKINDAFAARYRLAAKGETLRDAALGAVREVVGRTTIDEVLSEKRGAVESETMGLLQNVLDSYGAGLSIRSVQLQEVQPPPEVRQAFDDVIAAAQDRDRQINEAEGYANEVLPRARAEASEIVEAGLAYRDATIARAKGETQRFDSIAAEFRRAPEVTRERLYLEAMEEILADVELVILETESTPVLPYLPLGNRAAP